VLCVAGSAVLAALLPRFWTYDARATEDVPPPPARGSAPAPP
jgi:hypothetical protein